MTRSERGTRVICTDWERLAAGDCDCAREIGEGVTFDDEVEVGICEVGTCKVCDGAEGVCVTCEGTEGVLQARVVCRDRQVISDALRLGRVRGEG